MRYSTFYDFTQSFRFDWLFQALWYRDVYYWWDNKNKAWCRKVKDVAGKVLTDDHGTKVFVPKNHPVVNYWQIIDNEEEFFKNEKK